MKVPIIMLTKERPLQFIDMMESLERLTDGDSYNIIICDNGSEHPDMRAYLKSIEKKHKVIYNGTNLLFKGLNPGLKEVNDEHFIITDPDLKLNDNIPPDWISKFIMLLNEYPGSPKIGMALDTNFSENTRLTRAIKGFETMAWERKFNTNIIPDDCYLAPTDTTMCMYRSDTYDFWGDGVIEFTETKGIVPLNYITQDHYHKNHPDYPIRVAGRFMAKHLGWYIDKKYFAELEYYRARSDSVLSSSIREMYNLIIEHHGRGV